jgi:hypothetical protein
MVRVMWKHVSSWFRDVCEHLFPLAASVAKGEVLAKCFLWRSLSSTMSVLNESTKTFLFFHFGGHPVIIDFGSPFFAAGCLGLESWLDVDTASGNAVISAEAPVVSTVPVHL